MRAFVLHFYYELRSDFRRKQQVFLNYLFPIAFFLMIGAIMPQLNPLFLDDMIPAMLIFTVMSSCFLGIPDPLVSDRQSGIFRGYRVNGVPAAPLLALPVLSSAVHTLITSALIIILAPLLFDAPMPENTGRIIPVLLLSVYACGGISLLIGVVSSSTRASMMLSQMFFIPSMIIGGLMVPYELLPGGIRKAALLLPSTHSMNLLTRGAGAELPFRLSAAVLAGAGTLCIILSAVFFRWNSKK